MSMSKEGSMRIKRKYGSFENYEAAKEKKFYEAVLEDAKKHRKLTKEEEEDILSGKTIPYPRRIS